jgi:hypothetical protein
MLTPNRPIALLPQDRQIMQLTGMSEKDYRFFMRQAILHSKLRPGEPTNFLIIPFLVKLVIGVALTYLATLLMPKPKQPEQRQLDVNTVQGQNLVNGARFTPKSGFDSVQNVVELGSVIPLVYSNRQVIDGVAYGGVRVNTNLLWSQLQSIGGGQMLRAVFLIGEANITDLDAEQFAIGNNLINGYDLSSDYGRITIYSSPDGGRLKSVDRIAGQLAANDEGNAENGGGGDVFQVRGIGNSWTTDFCFTSTPSNQTTFGLYGFIGNNMPFRVNPVFRPARKAETRSDGELNCTNDDQQIAERQKQNYVFAGRAGVVGAEDYTFFPVGSDITVQIYKSTDIEKTFSVGDDGEVSCGDVGQSVASRQRSNDEQINYGDIYRIGTALAICRDRSDAVFVSDADNEPVGGGTTTTAIFNVIREGSAHVWSANTLQSAGGYNATQTSHIMQSAEAIFSTERQGRIVEVGIRSNLQVNIGGLCNFKDARGYERIDYDACDKDDGKDIEDAKLTNFTSGQYSTIETRYSFFRVSYRVAGSDDTYTDMSQLFGVRSTTGVAVYNYLRFEFPDERRWEIRMTPISGWEVRSGAAPGTLEVLDPHMGNLLTAVSGGVSVQYTGEQVPRTENTFAIQSLSPLETQITAVNTAGMTPGKGYQAGTYNDVTLDATSGPGRNARGNIVVTVPMIPNPLNPGTQIPDPAGGSVTSFTLTGGGSLFSVGDNLRIRDPEDIPGLIASVVPITQVFEISVTAVVKKDLGNGFDDGTFYADAWARLSEGYIYNEITASTTQPEHAVVYLNCITANPTAPNYDNMAIVGMNIRSSKEIRSLQQFSVYVNKGIKATSSFPAVLLDLLTNDRYGTGQVLNPAQIDQDSFAAASVFTDQRKYFFDGAVSDKINIRTWGAEVASNYLLDLVIRNGRFALEPVANFYGSEVVTQLFTSGNILEDSFSLSFADEQDRIPPRISVIWREERETSGTITRGLFPVSREVSVRENTTPEDAPLEKIDLSNYCTSERHAIDRAKWECLSRRYVTHTINFKTTPAEAALDLGAVFKVGMETINYNQPQNGAIAANGEVTAWPPIDDGTYDVLLWDGKTQAIQETSINIINGESSPTGSVFCLRNATSNIQTYKTQSLSFDEEGNIDVVATFFPTDAASNSLMVNQFSDSNFVIEGNLSVYGNA